MSPAIGKSLKTLLLAATMLSGSCSISPESDPTNISAHVANWHPEEPDGVSLDHIRELWQDVKSMEGVSLIPGEDTFASMSFDIVEKTGDSHVLVDSRGNEYSLPEDISSPMLVRRESLRSGAWILVFTVKGTNERRVLAVALDGGPFYKTVGSR